MGFFIYIKQGMKNFASRILDVSSYILKVITGRKTLFDTLFAILLLKRLDKPLLP
jgi:hypothetical protein